MDGTAEGSRIRRASADDAAGIAAVLNRVIVGGRHSLLDTPFTEPRRRAYIEALPERAFIHAAETPRTDRRLPDRGALELLRDARVRSRRDHGDVRVGGVPPARRGHGARAMPRSPRRAPRATRRSSPTCAPTTSTPSATISVSASHRGERAPPRAAARPRHRRRVHRSVPVRRAAVLYVCATPIGNLGDVTPRVLDALRERGAGRRGGHAAHAQAPEPLRYPRAADEPLPAQRGAEDRGSPAPAARG